MPSTRQDKPWCAATLCAADKLSTSHRALLATIGGVGDRMLAHVVSGCHGKLQELTSTGTTIPPHR